MFEDVDNKQAQPQAQASAAQTPQTPAQQGNTPSPAQASQEEIHTMPMDYYMGAKTTQAVKGMPAAPQQVMPQAQMSAGPSQTTGGGSKKKLLNIGIVVVLVLVLGVSAYLLYASYQEPKPAQNVADNKTVQPVVETETPVVEEIVEEVVVEEETPDVVIEEEPSTVMFDPNKLNQVSLTLLASQDTDKDGLTDAEEEIIGTSISQNDTDGDTYRDAEEIKNYYSPLQAGSVKLNETNFVATYENNPYGYKLLYPKGWIISPLNEDDPRDVMITSAGNEFINIFLNQKPENQSLEDWYLQKAPSVSSSELKKYENHNKLAVIESPDAFTVYVARGTDVYIINYNIGLNDEANYPNLFAMIVNSFELTEKVAMTPVSLSSLLSFLGVPTDIEDMVSVSGTCSSKKCVVDNVSNCNESNINLAFGEDITYQMQVSGECRVESRFVKHLDTNLVNKNMTCSYDKGASFNDAVLESECSGDLYDLLTQ